MGRKMFFGDKEIKGIKSFSVKIPKTKKEDISFTGIYDPSPEQIFKEMEGKIITGTIYGLNGKKRQARLRIGFDNNEITLEPTNNNTRKWVKRHVFGIKE